MIRIKNQNKSLTLLLIIFVFLSYVFFFTSNLTIPKAITAKEDTTSLNSLNEYMESRSYKLVSATYDETKEMMEINLVLNNNSFDGINKYYYAFTLNHGNTKNTLLEEVFNDTLMTVIRISGIKKNYRELTFMFSPQTRKMKNITDEQTAFVSLNKYNVVEAKIDLNKTKVDYLIERLKSVISEYEKSLMRFEQNLDKNEASIIAATAENRQLENNEKFMTDMEIEEAEKQILENEEQIKKMKSESKDYKEKISKLQDLIRDSKKKLQSLN